MRLFYKSDDIAIEFTKAADGKSSVQTKGTLSDAQALVDSGDGIIYDTIDKLDEALAYAESRREAYPPIQEQLDLLFHELTASGSLTTSGSWYQTIKSIKDANPKG